MKPDDFGDYMELVDSREYAALKWLANRDGNLDLHETFCNTNYDDDAACDCRIAKARQALTPQPPEGA